MTDDELIEHCEAQHALIVGEGTTKEMLLRTLRRVHDKLHTLNTHRLHMHGTDGSVIDLTS